MLFILKGSDSFDRETNSARMATKRQLLQVVMDRFVAGRSTKPAGTFSEDIGRFDPADPEMKKGSL